MPNLSSALSQAVQAEIQNHDPLWVIRDICQELHKSRATVLRLRQSGEFPRPIVIGKHPSWRRSAVLAFLASKERDDPVLVAQTETTTSCTVEVA
ncbi:MAG: hypothetical protein HQL87_09760 [Magnetococcales bacterium]|nr:hypothetical protein [Magnetococcales bacterium]